VIYRVFVIDEDYVVIDADSPEEANALWAIRPGRSNMTGPQNIRDLRVSWSRFI
jgi:hypothetical protein